MRSVFQMSVSGAVLRREILATLDRAKTRMDTEKAQAGSSGVDLGKLVDTDQEGRSENQNLLRFLSENLEDDKKYNVSLADIVQMVSLGGTAPTSSIVSALIPLMKMLPGFSELSRLSNGSDETPDEPS